MKKGISKRICNSIIQVTIFVLCISSICVAVVQEFNDVNDFEVAAGTQQYLIDFESYGDGTPVVNEPNINGDEWLNLGIQFAGMEVGDSLILSEKAGMAVSPTHALATSNVSNRCSTLITFSAPVVSFGIYIVDNETTSPTERIILKDDSNNVLGDFAMPGGLGPAPPLPIAHDFRGYSSTIPIAEVHIIEDSDGEGSLLDNAMYSVPILLSSPNGGEELIAGQTETISWDSAGDINYVSLEYSANNGVSWSDVNSSTANDGSYDWVVPEVTSNQCLVRVSDVNDANIYDTSDDVFTIFQCLGPVPGDLNNDCYVDFLDFAIVAEHWLHTGNPLDPASGIIACWHFDEGSGTIAHDSAGNNDGNLVGDANWVNGISGKALYFDGNGDCVDVLDANALDPVSTQEITIVACVNLPTYEAQNSSVFFGIVGKTANVRPDGSYLFGIWNDGAGTYETGKLMFGVPTGNNATYQFVNSNSLVPLNDWVHVAITHDSSNITKIYIDGQVDITDSSTITQAFENNDKDLRIGYSGRYADYFYGSTDEVRIYNRALSESEIQYLYENP